MTGLPAGVTLEAIEGRSFLVVWNGRPVGTVQSGFRGGWWSGHREGRERTCSTLAQAVRWVCLQARPVVYTVRRDPAWREFPWRLTSPDGGTLDHYATHAVAVRVANILARQRAARMEARA